MLQQKCIESKKYTKYMLERAQKLATRIT